MTYAHNSLSYPGGDIREPKNPSELRRFIKIGRPHQHREVEIWRSKSVYSNRSSDHVFEIDVHPESELIIRVHNGLPFFKLMRGTSRNVKLVFGSSWGNSLEIFPGQGAEVEVLDRSKDFKVTITGDGRDLNVHGALGRTRNYTHTDPAIIERVFETRAGML